MELGWLGTKKGLEHELRRLSNVDMHTVGVSKPSLHRESTNSLVPT